jgi:peroxiredoxin
VRKVLASLAFLLLATGCDRGQHPGNIGKLAPQFAISDDTNSVDLSKLRGHTVILNFWATNCAPCVEELPTLLELHRQRPDLDIIAISIDDDPDAYHRFLIKHHIDLKTIRDPDQKINTLYGTAQIPETYVIDKNGILRRKFVSSQDWTSPEITGYLKNL